MMTEYLSLATRLTSELDELDQVLQRAEEGLRRAQTNSDDYYLDGVALNLHGYYAGLERIFELVVSELEHWRPADPHWHQTLLRHAATPVTGVRPALISAQTRDRLDTYRSFRHIVRNVYTHNLQPARLAELVNDLVSLHTQVRAEITQFVEYLNRLAQEDAKE
ncbi:MAG: hypothetical protein GXP41_10300 [Chloroflexi bacterium]|nr:hypothetical protein [Chloroflexota bacterium]